MINYATQLSQKTWKKLRRSVLIAIWKLEKLLHVPLLCVLYSRQTIAANSAIDYQQLLLHLTIKTWNVLKKAGIKFIGLTSSAC